MSMRSCIHALPLIIAAACNGTSGDANARTTDVEAVSITPREQDYKVVASFPHDPGAWTQGLFFHNGALIECTGQETKSVVREVEINTGTVKREIRIPDEYFGEGCVVAGDKLFQITWQNHKGFVYNFSDLKKVGEWTYTHEGWGLTYDGTNLILSDGTATLRFLNPRTYAVVKTVEVTDNGKPIDNLNELELVKGEL